MFQYDNEEDSFSTCSNESEEDDEGEIPVEGSSNKSKKGKKGRRGQWTEQLADDLLYIILDNNKYKEKLLFTNVKNVEYGQYYGKVIEELKKKRCSERGEELPFNVAQTRQKFKSCINICRDAAMKVKTSSSVKHLQQDKELGSWFGKLLSIASSMDNCQLQQAIEPGRKAPETNDKEANLEESHDDDICKEHANQGSFSRSSDGALNAEREYVPTLASRKESSGQTESLLTKMKETMNTLKTLAFDTFSSSVLCLNLAISFDVA